MPSPGLAQVSYWWESLQVKTADSVLTSLLQALYRNVKVRFCRVRWKKDVQLKSFQLPSLGQVYFMSM